MILSWGRTDHKLYNETHLRVILVKRRERERGGGAQACLEAMWSERVERACLLFEDFFVACAEGLM